MPEEVITVVKIPLWEIEKEVRVKHSLPSKLTDARIEGDVLILSFMEDLTTVKEKPPVYPQFNQRKRRVRKKRNRMKTRGWAVVGRITNSKGQKCSIYKPFVDALENHQQLTAEEQRQKVEAILRANKNKPSEESIQYFLGNTLEYLQNSVSVVKVKSGAEA
jgi:hypothetical protein